MECTIGNIGVEVKQPSNPFSNLSQHGVLQAQINALKAMIPDLDYNNTKSLCLPKGAEPIGDNFVLLHACDKSPQKISEMQAQVISVYLTGAVAAVTTYQWA